MVAHVKGVPRRSKKLMVWSVGTAGDEQYFDIEETQSELLRSLLSLKAFMHS
jgi:hypothetical protein